MNELEKYNQEMDLWHRKVELLQGIDAAFAELKTLGVKAVSFSWLSVVHIATERKTVLPPEPELKLADSAPVPQPDPDCERCGGTGWLPPLVPGGKTYVSDRCRCTGGFGA